MNIAMVLCVLFSAFSANAAELRGVEMVQDEAGKWQLHLLMDAPYPPKSVFTLKNPHRVVVDMPKFTSHEKLTLTKGEKPDWLKTVRGGEFNSSTSRMVVDVARAVGVTHRLNVDRNRLVLTLQTKEHKGAGAAKESGAPLLVYSRVPKVKGADITGTLVEPQRKPNREDRMPIVIVDAGHGGKDEGARGLKGTREKDVTLKAARMLKEALEKEGIRAILTRDDDEFLYLKDRVAFARAHHGDVFISIHADASPSPDASGFSVYTLSEKASDAEAAALAQQENRSDMIDGLELATQDEDVAEILVSLIHRETQNASIALADELIAQMPKEVKRLKNPHRYANFRVLKAPDIPSVLIEMGFLTNEGDEAQLKHDGYLDVITKSIARTIQYIFN